MTEESYVTRKIFGTSEFREAVVSAVALLASFCLAWLLESVAGLNLDVIVLAVVLSLRLGRTQRGQGAHARIISLLVLAAITVGASEVGRVMRDHPNIGDVLFTAALGLSIWIRRFGPTITTIGTVITMPFIVMLVTPMPLPPGAAAPLWGAAAAAIAFACVSVTQLLADRLGFTTPPSSSHQQAPVVGPARGIRPSTKMALQMMAAVGAAFAVGRWAYPDHWPWVVLTAFIVCSGNRGRADVVYKAGLRIVGAAAGTVAATLVAGIFGPADPRSVVVILAVLAIANWLRTLNYAYWAASVTAALSLLYGYFGQSGSMSLLEKRLSAIVVGAAIAIAATWLILPINSTQVLRRRAADVLAVLTDLGKAVREEPERVPHHQVRFRQALGRVDQVARPLQVHWYLTKRWRNGPHAADVVDVVRGSASAVARAGVEDGALAELGRARAELGRILVATRPAADQR